MAVPHDPCPWRRTMAPRLGLLAGLFAACAVAVVARLAYLEVFRYDHYVAKSLDQQQRVVEVPAERGEILDRNGRVLATSVEEATVKVTRRKITDPAKAVAMLCGALGCDGAERARLGRDLARRSGHGTVRRLVNTDQARRVVALGIDGIYLVPEPRRWYPHRELAGHLVGFVGLDNKGLANKGLAGLEQRYDSLLRGTPGQVLAQVDADQETFNRVGRPPVPGQTLELTIDATLQYIAERELRAGVEENKALGGSIVILDPWSGEILAMASDPPLNANLFGSASPEQQRNRPVQDMYEPGSTFKIVTASAALEEKVWRTSDLVDTNPGYVRIGARTIDEYEQHRYGVLSFSDVLVKSSNVGAVRIGWRIGAPTLARYVGLFGFGTRLSPDFRGNENAGSVWQPSQFNEGAVASVSMGYQVSVTPLQMASAASVIANGGELVQPRVVRAVIDGNQRQLVPRKVLRRVISPGTAAELTTIMEAVVDRGTATRAKLEDFTVAGKTGTSNKNENGHYIEEYNTSFVGFVPSRKPAMTVLVHIDAPSKHGPNKRAGGAVAAPIFRRVADAALRYMGVAPTIDPVAPLLIQRNGAPGPIPVSAPSAPMTIVPALAPLSAGQIVVPDLRGLSGREALRVLSGLGITPRMTGDGLVMEQDPPPGTPIDIGATCRLALRRAIPEIQQ
jgi:cell division protein FtsI (penicillin-binding protein 3)